MYRRSFATLSAFDGILYFYDYFQLDIFSKYAYQLINKLFFSKGKILQGAAIDFQCVKTTTMKVILKLVQTPSLEPSSPPLERQFPLVVLIILIVCFGWK